MGLQDRSYLQWDGSQSPYGGGGGMTWVTRIVIINAVVWVIDMFPGNPMTTYLSLRSDLFLNQYHVYTLLTSGFVHANQYQGMNWLTHIAFNMLTLWFLGRVVEQVLGWKEFVSFYLLSIVFANSVWLLTTWLGDWMFADSAVQSVVGASGGVAAVVILFAFKFPQQRISVWGVIELPAWVVGVIMVALDVFRATSVTDSRVAVMCHLGGAGFAAMYHLLNWNFIDFWGRMFPNAFAMFRRGPRLRVHRPSRDDDHRLAEQADRILDKLHREGEASLTNKERRLLEKYSRRVRKKKNSDAT